MIICVFTVAIFFLPVSCIQYLVYPGDECTGNPKMTFNYFDLKSFCVTENMTSTEWKCDSELNHLVRIFKCNASCGSCELSDSILENQCYGRTKIICNHYLSRTALAFIILFLVAFYLSLLGLITHFWLLLIRGKNRREEYVAL